MARKCEDRRGRWGRWYWWSVLFQAHAFYAWNTVLVPAIHELAISSMKATLLAMYCKYLPTNGI